jgi:hypothetical protein
VVGGQCLNTFIHSSDHNPILARVLFPHRPDDNSIKYWRLRLENLKNPDILTAYKDQVNLELPDLIDKICSHLLVGVTRLSPNGQKQIIVDAMELDVVSRSHKRVH